MPLVLQAATSGQATLTPTDAATVTLTLPATSGTLVSTGSIPAAGSTTQVQYNNAGALAGSANFVFDGTNVGIGTSSPAAVTGFSAGRTVLQVTPSGGGSAQLRLGAASGTMIDHDDGGNTITTIRNLYGATSATAQMQLQSGFITLNTGTSYTEQMRLNAAGLLQFNSGYGSVATAYGCRAWVNFNGTGTVAIRASGNVSSITDNGTGDYTVNFSTALPDADYAVAGVVNEVASNNGASVVISNTTAPTSSAVRVLRIQGNTTTPNSDCSIFCVSIHR
jgi:hypothetical protein